MPLFFPVVHIAEHLDARGAVPLCALVERAGVRCRASGPFTERRVKITRGEPFIEKEPGDWSVVHIQVPADLSARDVARYATAAMAYALMDIVARASICGERWATPSPPLGRPRSGRAQTNAARQRALRARQRARRFDGISSAR
jgi:hypothetical protein